MATLEEFSNSRPPLRGTPREIDFPAPAGYRLLHPAALDLPPPTAKGRLFQRKRLLIGLGVVAALHLALILGWLLTPPLRLKAGIDPERWLPVVSIPRSEATSPAAALAVGAPPAQALPPPDPASNAPLPAGAPATPSGKHKPRHSRQTAPSPAAPIASL